MNVVRRLFLQPLLIALLGLAGAHAQEPDLTASEAWALERIVRFSRGGQPSDKVADEMLFLFERSDITGGGVSRDDIVARDQSTETNLRVKLLKNWLVFDMDGDGIVTRAETTLRQQVELKLRTAHRSSSDSVRTQVTTTLSRMVADIFKADKNEDGQVTFREMLAYARTDAKSKLGPHTILTIVPLSLDQDGDGRVSRSEYLGVVNRLLEETDADSDGIISKDEGAKAKRRAKHANSRIERKELFRTLAADCAFPTPGAEAHIAFVHAFGSDTASNVKFAGSGMATITTVRIEDGTRPLYLILASGPQLIWRFTGAHERIAHVVAVQYGQETQRPLLGVVGLTRDKVHMPGRAGCLDQIHTSKDLNRRDGILGYMLGRVPDAVIAHERISHISLPSGVLGSTPAKTDTWPEPVLPGSAIVWQEAALKYPGGFARIDAESVISGESVTQTEELPGYAGLAQLVDQGALEVTHTQRVTRFGLLTIIGGSHANIKTTPNGPKPRDVDIPVRFLIHKAMAFPEGHLDTSELRFLLAPGVPVPTNMDEDICLAEQQTGRLVNGNPEKCIF